MTSDVEYVTVDKFNKLIISYNKTSENIDKLIQYHNITLQLLKEMTENNNHTIRCIIMKEKTEDINIIYKNVVTMFTLAIIYFTMGIVFLLFVIYGLDTFDEMIKINF